MGLLVSDCRCHEEMVIGMFFCWDQVGVSFHVLVLDIDYLTVLQRDAWHDIITGCSVFLPAEL